MNKAKEYNPVPVYCRKLWRNMLREQIIKRDGYHNVSGTLHEYWEKLHSIKVANDKEGAEA